VDDIGLSKSAPSASPKAPRYWFPYLAKTKEVQRRLRLVKTPTMAMIRLMRKTQTRVLMMTATRQMPMAAES